MTPPAGTRPRRPWRRHPLVWLPLAALGGAVQSVASFESALWPLPLIAIALLAWAVGGATARGAAALGWAFGTGWLCAGTWWLFISLHRYGGLPWPLAVAAVGLLAAFLSIYLGLAMAWVAHRQRRRPWRDATRFAAAWLAAELARGVIFTGFPWAASGYSQVDGPLAVLAPWVGVYGLGALMAWAAALAGYTLRAGTARRQRADGPRPPCLPAGGAALAVLLLPALWGAVRGAPDFTQPSRSLRVALLQTNVAQDEKFAIERLPDALAWVANALASAQADLVITPETAVPLLPDQLQEIAPGYWSDLQRQFNRADGAAALVGVPLGNSTLGYTNSVVGLGPGLGTGGPVPGQATSQRAADYRYDKTHLVPFGEFIPTGFRWFTELMQIPLGDFNRGPANPPSFAVRGERVAPNVCYEDLFGEELARRFAVPATSPTILANVSNIGWFGNTIALPQHLNISRMRSLELQRPMLRATNTGMTAVIDHRGVVTGALKPFTQGVLQASVQGRTGLTPFARWAAAWGLWPLLALAAAGLLLPRPRARAGR